MMRCNWSNLTSAEESNMHHVTPLALHFGIVLEKGAFLSRAMRLVLWIPKAVLHCTKSIQEVATGTPGSLLLYRSSFVAEWGRMLLCTRLAAVSRMLLCGSDA